MIRHFCPHCDQTVSSSDSLAGLKTHCPHCRLSLEVPAQAVAPDAPPRAPAQAPGQVAAPAAPAWARRRCVLCDEVAETTTCYVRVFGGTISGTSAATWWANLRSHCCAPCLSKGGRLKRLGWLVLALIAGVPLACLGLGVLLAALGVPSATVTGPFVVAAVLLSLANVVLCLVVLHFAARRHVQRLLHAETDERVKALTGVQHWGLMHLVHVSQHLPRGQTALELH